MVRRIVRKSLANNRIWVLRQLSTKAEETAAGAAEAGTTSTASSAGNSGAGTFDIGRVAAATSTHPAPSSAGRARPAAGHLRGPYDGAGAVASRLFEKVQAQELEGVAEAARVASATGASAGTGAGAEAPTGHGSPASAALRALSNTILYGSLAATAYLGYFQVVYTADQVATMVKETGKPENAFPGSEVWREVMGQYVDQRRYLEGELKKYQDPPSERLLPDLPANARHIRTLVLDLDETLVHSDWTRGRGWRTFKRPGAEDFLRQVAQYYEVVVYTSQLPSYADPVLERLDTHHAITYRLYRDSTQYMQGKHVRNLESLNRDLSKVLLITSDPDAYHLQPDNAVKLKPWKLEGEDTALLDLLPFLELIFRTNVPDVRDVVRSFQGQDIPTAFRERIRQLKEQQQQQQQQQQGRPRRMLGFGR